MKSKIINIEVKDIRFPTSKNLDGSDAMNAISDYSATYVTLRTDANDDLVGNGLTFTIGRGNELCVQAVKSLSELFVQDRYLKISPLILVVIGMNWWRGIVSYVGLAQKKGLSTWRLRRSLMRYGICGLKKKVNRYGNFWQTCRQSNWLIALISLT